jgi:DnaA family protein
MTQDLLYEQIPINFGFYLKKTLDNFIVGNNQDLYKSLRNIGDINQLILIYGSKSSGKSHISEAMMHLKLNNSIQVNRDTNFDSLSISDYYDLVVIDDIDKIISNQRAEELLFTLIDNQILHKKSSVITSTIDIKDCNITLRDLISRLQSDKIFNINDLNDEDKIKLMMFYCTERGIEVPKKVINYIINNCSRDLYFLCAFIKTIDKASLSMKKRITIPFIKKVISKLAS